MNNDFTYDNNEYKGIEANLNTFDEGVDLGGMRSKYEIRILICYLFYSIKKPLDRDLILEIIQQKSLANYFETASCFNDLLIHNNLELVDEKEKLYKLTANGEMVAKELERTIASSVKERAYACALEILEQRQVEKENTVTISKLDNGYNVNFKISGGSVDLLSFDMFAPDINQAKLMRKNFYKRPGIIYKSIIGCLTGNKDLVNESLMDIAKDF